MSTLPYVLAKWLLSTLPVDAAGRRCFDETLADWRREAAKANGAFAGAIVAVRAMGSVLRSVAGVTFREMRLFPQSGVPLRLVFWMAAFLTVVPLIYRGSLTFRGVGLSSPAYLYVGDLLRVLPVTLLLATAVGRDRRSTSGLGLALAAVITAVSLLGWALPAANSAFLEANRARYTNPQTPEEAAWRRPRRPGEGLTMSTMGDVAVDPVAPNLFMNDLTLPQLGVRVVRGPGADGWAAIRWLSFFGAYLSICALAPILATTLRRRQALVRYSIVIITAAVLWRPVVLSRLGGEFSVAVWLGAFWIPVAWMAVCLLFAAQRDTSFQSANNQ